MPAISVIVPVYKVEPYLRRCVDSILEQTFSDFELILVDDGSPDNCPAICDEYKKKDSRVHVIHQENGGLSAARNAGIDWAFANSNSQWLTFIDSDDWVHPEYLERLRNAAIGYDTDISICGYVRTDSNEPVIDVSILETTVWTPEDFFLQHNVNAIIVCGKLYRKELFCEIRFPFGKLHEDEFTTYKLLFKNEKLTVILSPLYFYYNNVNSITNVKWNRSKMNDLYTALEEQIDFFSTHDYPVIAHYLMRRYVNSVSSKFHEFFDDKEAACFFRSKLKDREHFRTYTKQLDVNDQTDAWVLTRAFPFRMKVYWYVRAIMRKLGFVQ